MIYLFLAIGIVFATNIFVRFDKPNSKFYKIKIIFGIFIGIIYISYFLYLSYHLYFAVNTISEGPSKQFDLEINNNSNNEVNLLCYFVNYNGNIYKQYYTNIITISNPDNLLQNTIIKPKNKIEYKFLIPDSTYLLILDKNTNLGIKTYRTDNKMILYMSDFSNISQKIEIDRWREIYLIVLSIFCYFVIIFFMKKLPNKLLIKLVLILPLILCFIVSSYNLYILIRLIGSI